MHAAGYDSSPGTAIASVQSALNDVTQLTQLTSPCRSSTGPPHAVPPGTVTAAEDTVPPEVKKERGARLRALSDELCRRRWRSKVGTIDRVLVDRPGRGYADDYTPWLLDAEVGRLVSARAIGLSQEGIVAVAA